MGPNNKGCSRKQYVNRRIRVLKELGIDPPPQDVIDRMMDEKQMSEIAVDSIFLGITMRAEQKG